MHVAFQCVAPIAWHLSTCIIMRGRPLRQGTSILSAKNLTSPIRFDNRNAILRHHAPARSQMLGARAPAAQHHEWRILSNSHFRRRYIGLELARLVCACTRSMSYTRTNMSGIQRTDWKGKRGIKLWSLRSLAMLRRAHARYNRRARSRFACFTFRHT